MLIVRATRRLGRGTADAVPKFQSMQCSKKRALLYKWKLNARFSSWVLGWILAWSTHTPRFFDHSFGLRKVGPTARNSNCRQHQDVLGWQAVDHTWPCYTAGPQPGEGTRRRITLMKSWDRRALDFIRVFLSSSSSPDFSAKNVRIWDKLICNNMMSWSDHSKQNNYLWRSLEFFQFFTFFTSRVPTPLNHIILDICRDCLEPLGI